MVTRDPIGTNPLALLIVALVGWIVIRLVLGLLRQAGFNFDRVSTSVEWGSGDDGTHHGAADQAGDGGGHGGDAGGDGGGDGGH